MSVKIQASDEIMIENFENAWMRAIFTPTGRCIAHCEKTSDSPNSPAFWTIYPGGKPMLKTHIEAVEMELFTEAERRLESPGFRDSEVCKSPANCPKCGTSMIYISKCEGWVCGAFCHSKHEKGGS